MNASLHQDTGATESVASNVQELFDQAREGFETVEAILDVAAVLTALERAPVHQDTHPSHDIRTGGGYAHGRRLAHGSLPKLLAHACGVLQLAMNDVDVLREMAVDALKERRQP